MNKFILGLIVSLFVANSGTLKASVAIDLADEESKTRPVMLVMYSARSKSFDTKLADARLSVTRYKANIAEKNSFVVTLQAREDLEFSDGGKTYKAAEDAGVRFVIFLGASGTLGTHTGAIPLHKDFYWPDNKDKIGAANVTTVLAGLRQWAGTLNVADINTHPQAVLCQKVEDKLQNQ